MRDIKIFDTTLRDGEQSPGFSMSLGQKLRVARALAELQVDIIEAGFPAASPGDFESVAEVARQIEGPTIAALCRTVPKDIERAAAALRAAGLHFRGQPQRLMASRMSWVIQVPLS